MTEESHPSLGNFTSSNIIRATNATPDGLRRLAILGIVPSHSRTSTDPSSDLTLPPPGPLSKLKSQSSSGSHSRAVLSPGIKSSPNSLLSPTTHLVIQPGYALFNSPY